MIEQNKNKIFFLYDLWQWYKEIIRLFERNLNYIISLSLGAVKLHTYIHT